MSQWLEMRIQEEKERRDREARTLERLPSALEEVHGELRDCIANYTAAFGAQTAAVEADGGKLRVTVRDEQGGEWVARATVEVAAVPELPGFRIERGQQPRLEIQVGLLPGDKLFYRDGDEYIGLAELSRRILDRALFPKLAE